MHERAKRAASQKKKSGAQKNRTHKPAPKPTSGPSAAPPAQKPASGAAMPACPECGKQFRTDAAVQTHRHAAHGTAAMVVGNMTRCPDCGSLVKNSHMTRHRRREHGLQ